MRHSRSGLLLSIIGVYHLLPNHYRDFPADGFFRHDLFQRPDPLLDIDFSDLPKFFLSDVQPEFFHVPGKVVRRVLGVVPTQ